MTLHWSIAISESAFIGDTITLLDILHWDTLHWLMVDFWDADLFWGIALSSVMDFNLSWSIVTSDGLYWDIAVMESIFHWSIATLLNPLHWGISILWRKIRLILNVGASDEWYGDYWIVSCYPHSILGHSDLVGCLDIETWLSVYDCYFWWIMELLTPWV